MGEIANHHGASLYYPAAGLDFDTFLATGIEKAVFLDAAYLRSSRMPRRDTKALMRRIKEFDADAAFHVDADTNALVARFRTAGRRRTMTLIRGVAGEDEHIVRRHVGKRTLVLMKGCLLPEVLLPPRAIEHLSPVAFALELLDMPPYSVTIEDAYDDCRLRVRSGPRQQLVFGRYHFRPGRLAQAEAQFHELLKHAPER
jgi:hypothetical protein